MLLKLYAFFASKLGQELYKVARDAVEAAIQALIVLNFALPGDLNQAKAEGLVAVSVVAGAIIAVVRRELIPWILGQALANP